MLRDFQTASSDRYSLLKEYARKNRNNPTTAEVCLWQRLRGKVLGEKFKRQHIIYDYIADFVCLDRKLVVEIDGAYHFTEKQSEEDIYRTKNLEQFGFRVIRFTNEEIMIDINKVVAKIKESLYEQ